MIAVFDPTFTLLLLIPLFISLRRPASGAVRIGLLLGLTYLGAGYLQHQRAETSLLSVASQRGHVIERASVKPTMANLLLWRSIYVHQGRLFADAHHLGLTIRHYPGVSKPILDGFAAKHSRDVERFRVFADDYLVDGGDGLIGDARYAMLPTAIEPIWGIRWGVNDRVEFVTRHEMSSVERKRWLDMLLGRP